MIDDKEVKTELENIYKPIGKQQQDQPENLQTVDPVLNTEQKPDEIITPVENKSKRATKTAIFSPDEFTNVEAVFNARQAAGITTDWNHFLRQCVDFACNCKHVENSKFATPDVPQFFLKNGFFKP